MPATKYSLLILYLLDRMGKKKSTPKNKETKVAINSNHPKPGQSIPLCAQLQDSKEAGVLQQLLHAWKTVK